MMGAFLISLIFSLYLFTWWSLVGKSYLFSATIQNERQDELISVKKGHEQEKVRTKTQPDGTFSFFKLVQVNA